MKKTIALIGLFIISLNIVSAIPDSFKYEDMTVMLYDHNINESSATQFLDTIRSYHYSGVDYLKIYNWDYCRKYLGVWGFHSYLWNRPQPVITICGFSRETLAHELAHNYEYEMNIPRCDIMYADGSEEHCGQFPNLMAQILKPKEDRGIFHNNTSHTTTIRNASLIEIESINSFNFWANTTFLTLNASRWVFNDKRLDFSDPSTSITYLNETYERPFRVEVSKNCTQLNDTNTTWRYLCE